MSLGLGEANRTPSAARSSGAARGDLATLFFARPSFTACCAHGTPELDRDAQFEREINEGEIQE